MGFKKKKILIVCFTSYFIVPLSGTTRQAYRGYLPYRLRYRSSEIGDIRYEHLISIGLAGISAAPKGR